MIVISGDLEIDPANTDAFLAAVETLVAATRAENGCNRYEFFRHLTEPGVFFIAEEWADDDALAAHMGTDHYKSFGRTLRSLGVTRVDIHRYEASSKSRLG